MKRFTIYILLLIHFVCNAWATETTTPHSLSEFSLLNVYSVSQDSIGAIWMSTTRGIYRYNGHVLDRLFDEVPSNCLVYGGGQYMFAEDGDRLITFNINDLSLTIREHNGSAFLAKGDSIILCPTLPEGEKAISIARTENGKILVGSDKGGLWDISATPRLEKRYSSSIAAIYEDSNERIFIGLSNGGFAIINQNEDIFIKECDGRTLSSVRDFCEYDGDIFIGDVGGLYRLSHDGVLRSETMAGIKHCPIFCLFKDKDSNMWIGTYHSGVHLANAGELPFQRIDNGLKGLMINGMCENGKGEVLIFTDGQGVYSLKTDDYSWSLIDHLPIAKYQGAFYDKSSLLIWAGVFHEGILCYNPINGTHRTIRFSDETVWSITPILRDGDDLLIGNLHGLYAFNPKREHEISRRIPGTQGLIYSLYQAHDSTIWAGGESVWIYREGRLEEAFPEISDILREPGANCYSMASDGNGTMWLALARKGVISTCRGNSTRYTVDGSGIQDNYTNCICTLTDEDILVCTATGLSIIGRSIVNYPAIRADAMIKLEDGKLILAGRDGIWVANWTGAERELVGNVRVDHVYLNGERFQGNETKSNHSEVSFDISSFEYSGASSLKFESKLEGFDRNWSRCSQESPIQYRELSPGKYTFKVRILDPEGRIMDEDSRSLIIRAPWYSTVWAKVVFSLTLLFLIAFIIYSTRSRRSLSDELRRKEQESRKKTSFLIDLSYNIRTPINLIIGKIERYFKDFGTRSAGSENIEDIYQRSQELRSMVNNFVDSKLDSLIEDKSVLKDSRFYNAAIGAVERNLFSPDLNVSLLCHEMHLGKTMLTKRLKESTGMTPRAFIEDVRLKHAAEMLRDGSQRVSEIADLLCFCSSKHFSERFNLKFGCNPRDYKSDD